VKENTREEKKICILGTVSEKSYKRPKMAA